MHKFARDSRILPWFMALLLSVLVAGCGGGGGQDPILGTGSVATLPPTVTAVAPVNNAAGVPINNTIATAAFSKDMNPATITNSTFTLTCPLGTPITGAVTYTAASRVATFTPAASLPPSTICTATITTGAIDTTGLRLVSNFVWTFTTGLAPDTTRPRVTMTMPATTIPGPTTGVPTNTAITAVFSEDMAPATINGASFTLTCAAPCVVPSGTVSYSVGSRTATFMPAAVLAVSTTYTATITTAATDLAGNQLAGNQADLPAASNYVWTFTSAGPVIPPVPGGPSDISVLAISPVSAAANVCPNATVSATFTVPSGARLDPSTFTSATFVVAGPAPASTPVIAASVALDAATGRIATFTPASALTAGVTYTVTIKGGANGVKDLVNPANTMPSDFTWTFTVVPATGACAITPPTPPIPPNVSVLSTNPAAGTTTVCPNASVNATFNVPSGLRMDPSTLTSTTFTLTGPALTPVTAASVVLDAATGRIATFTPQVALTSGVTYTATIKGGATGVKDLGSPANGMLSDFVWTFTVAPATGACATTPPAGQSNISVLSTNPAAGAAGVCPDASINATFSVPSGLRMDPSTVTTANFAVTGPAPASAPVTASSVVLDAATGRIATFTPASALTAGVTYTATIRGGASGVKDLAIPANSMASNFVWNFTVATCAPPPPVPSIALGSASSFGAFGGSAGVTNQGILTIINGDLGTTAVSTAVTGFHDAGPGCTYTETPLNVGTVNGKIYTAAPPPTVACPSEGTATTFAIATQARADALAAYNALVARPGGPDPGAGNLGSLVLAPGTYTAASGSFRIQGGNLTLDAQGNANAVWVFQMASTLTVGGPGAAFPQSIILANGAQAKNVFWQVGSAATINAAGGGTMVGTIISQSGVSFSTAGNVTILTLNGRALSLGASVTMVNTVINVPAP